MVTETRLSRRERNKIRNRREILDAAQEEFSERGFHDTSINDIAVRAEFAVGTIYALFGTKEDLYRELLLEFAKEATAAFTEALRLGDNEFEQLWNYVVAKGQLFKDKIKLARLIFTETLGTGICFKTGPNPELKAMYDQWHQQLAIMFRSGMENGIFREGGALALATALEGMTNQFLYQWQEDPDSFDYDRAITAMFDFFFKPILLVSSGATDDTTSR